MPQGDNNYFWKDAVDDLRKLGLDVEITGYGFQLRHEDSAGKYQVECGNEHDWSVSMSLRMNEIPARWFRRFSVFEMKELIAFSYRKIIDGEVESLESALNSADQKYDYDALDQRLTVLRREKGCRD